MKEGFFRSTLCYIEKDGCYLMLFRNKKEKDPCEGKWVGIGGKFEAGESADECCLREVFEETGLRLTDYQPRGVVHFKSDELPDEDMYLFTATAWEGMEDGLGIDGFDCNEGMLQWIRKEEVFSLNLWEGDVYFLRPLIEGEEKIEITYVYEGDHLVQFEPGETK